MRVQKRLESIVSYMQGNNFRLARLELKRLMKNENSLILNDDNLTDMKVRHYLLLEFNKHADKIKASFWNIDMPFTNFGCSEYELRLLADEESKVVSERANRASNFGVLEVSNIKMSDRIFFNY